jgi:hypothetical protein
MVRKKEITPHASQFAMNRMNFRKATIAELPFYKGAYAVLTFREKNDTSLSSEKIHPFLTAPVIMQNNSDHGHRKSFLERRPFPPQGPRSRARADRPQSRLTAKMRFHRTHCTIEALEKSFPQFLTDIYIVLRIFR